MWLYWFLFGVPALASYSPWRLAPITRLIMMAVTAVLLILIIGLRDGVGMDWPGYLNILHDDEIRSLGDILTSKEPGFGLINWVSLEFGWGLYGVNVMSAMILVAGLSVFVIRQPNVWGCLALAIPVLVIQLGMSGVRQACAIGCFCFAMNAFTDGRIIRYLAFTVLAVTFHQTAIFLVPLAAFVRGRIRPAPTIAAGIVLALLFYYGIKDVDFYTRTYIAQDLGGAAGALPRVAFNVVAAGLLFAFRKPWAELYPDYRLFSVLAVLTIVLTPFVLFAEVAVDRLEYYLVPFQIAVISRVPALLPQKWAIPFTVTAFAGYAGALAVWLNFSWIAQLAWLPYRSILLPGA